MWCIYGSDNWILIIIIYQYFIIYLPNFHISNSGLFLPSTLVLSFSIDVVLTPSISLYNLLMHVVEFQAIIKTKADLSSYL